MRDSVAVAFIGSAGVPNRYGGFEAFLEHCGPELVGLGAKVIVTCDKRLYADTAAYFEGMRRIFIGVPANGAFSILHDLAAFFAVYRQADSIVVLGVSGGLWFPLWRLLCDIGGKRLIVNIDGVEWRRSKHSWLGRKALKAFDALGQFFSHVVIFDNTALAPYVLRSCRSKAIQIAYSGDHVRRKRKIAQEVATALTICRIEPENNLEMTIEGALLSKLRTYTIVGNWENSAYGRALKEKFDGNPRLRLLEPIYDPERLAELRESCDLYIHGHSVGGTNPSLVEMLFYDCRILCFDCPFNRETAGDAAEYFGSAAVLSWKLGMAAGFDAGRRQVQRDRFTRNAIARAYMKVVTQCVY